MAEDTQERFQEVRSDLKKFESTFLAQHGRPATRDEIKADAKIYGMYNEYKALQKQLKEPAKTEVKKDGRILRERAANTVAATPQKSKKVGDTLEVPEPVIEQTPACVRCALGPTPQRDGEVLGIFDMLPSATPSQGNDNEKINPLSLVGATPSKKAALATSISTLSKTPQSSGKRYFLDTFAGTPLKRKADHDLHTPSTGKRHCATPSFLRRHPSMPIIREEADAEFAIPTPRFKRRNPFTRSKSLSNMVQELRRQTTQREDEDWDILNEIEAEERGELPQKKAPVSLVEDSQAFEMPLGPDQGLESAEEEINDPGALDANGNPRKVWKKKGLTRQTRRVIMRPVKHKAGKAAEAEEDGTDAEVVGETQLDDEMGAFLSGDELRDVEERHDSQQSDTGKPKPPKKSAANKKQDEPPASRKPKKVAPGAHANFRKLKIKNKNSKANGRRFGSRR